MKYRTQEEEGLRIHKTEEKDPFRKYRKKFYDLIEYNDEDDELDNEEFPTQRGLR